MTQKLDLNKIRDEIDKEKKSRNMTPSSLGESVGTGVNPKDTFLNGLINSLNSGQATPATNLIKEVENKVAVKNGENVSHRINETQPTAVVPQQNRPAPVDMSSDRGEQLFADLENKRKQTLAESIQQFSASQTGMPQQATAEYNGTQYLTQQPTATVPQTSVSQPMQINEGALVENVKNVVNGYLSENLGSVFEEAIKGTIIEMYAVERIKEVLNENRDLIKSVVIETIRDIQAKNKKK